MAVAQGDLEALRHLYRSFERPLYSLGVRWLRDPELAEELVQEVILRVWRRAVNFDPDRGSAGSWIFGVARNVAADLSRSARRLPVPVPDPLPEQAQADDEDAALAAWQVERALQVLPEDQQLVIRLAYGRQMTHSEIAEHLGIPLGTVKTRMYKGLKRLAGELEKMGIDERT
ncbi:MAG TPA: sigma-70 family RNA polymerase sigma factor [Actinomycetota bacterium]|nr:sigma-70 family RNA polymerase sigma factor [Actinomycetota bacterium]